MADPLQLRHGYDGCAEVFPALVYTAASARPLPAPISIIYNSVVTCRHITINSSASAPLNAMQIAVMMVSHGEVVMFVPEL